MLFVQEKREVRVLRDSELAALRRSVSEQESRIPPIGAFLYTIKSALALDTAYQYTDILNEKDKPTDIVNQAVYRRDYVFSMGRFTPRNDKFFVRDGAGSNLEMTLVQGKIETLVPDSANTLTVQNIRLIVEAGFKFIDAPSNGLKPSALIQPILPNIGALPLEERGFGGIIRIIPINELKYNISFGGSEPKLQPLMKLLRNTILYVAVHFVSPETTIIQ
jgi:hypothetical protein